jgi:hypothetical protein
MTAFFEWGNVPQWVGVIGAVGSAAVAARTFVVNSRDHRAACARRVWPISATPEDWPVESDPNVYNISALVRNDSDEPIFDCLLEMHRWDWTRKSVQTHESQVGGWLIGTINAHSDTEPCPLPVDDTPAPPKLGPTLVFPLSVSFRDGQGREWVRYPDGVLVHRRR